LIASDSTERKHAQENAHPLIAIKARFPRGSTLEVPPVGDNQQGEHHGKHLSL
jgi:hypothetical protein